MPTLLRTISRFAAPLLLALVVGCERPAPVPTASTDPPSTGLAAAPSALGGSTAFRAAAPSLARALGAPSVAVASVPSGTVRRVTTIFNTDYASAAVGDMRDHGFATITLSGVSGTVSRALLYWHGPTRVDPNSVGGLDANANVLVNGTPVHGTNIGLSNDNCWGYFNSMAYVADVTALVRSTGNGAYALTQFGGSGTVNTNGASLIVFFNDANNANNRDVVLYEGNDSNIDNPYDAPGWNVTLDAINYVSGTANMQLHVGDGQIWTDGTVIVNGVVIDNSGSIFNGNTVPAAFGGDHNGSLWDIRNFNVTSFLHPGVNTLALTMGSGSDCLSLVAATVDLPAGAAPTPTIAFVPSTISLSRTGTVTVYLYSSPTFDATQADPAEARLLIDNALPGAAVAKRAGTNLYLTGVGDYNGDTRMDRAFVFTMADLKLAGLTTASTAFVLHDGTPPFVFDGRPVASPTIIP